MTAEWRHAAARFQAFVAHLEPTAVERASAMAVASDVGLWLKRRFVRPRLDRAPEDGAFRIIGGCGKDTAMRSAVWIQTRSATWLLKEILASKPRSAKKA